MQVSDSDIQKKIVSLPQNVQHAIEGFDWASETMSIGQTYGLHIHEIEAFRQQTLLVILGMLPAARYENELMQVLGKSRETIASLVEQANEHIFTELQRRAFADDEEEEPEMVKEEVSYETLSSYQKYDHDPYNEPINPDDIRGVFQREGIELIDEDAPLRNNDNFGDFSLSPVEEHEPVMETSVPTSNNELDSLQTTALPYQEPIDETDLLGVRSHRIDTGVLENQHQSHPESILHQKNLEGEPAQPSNKINTFAERFDQHLMENPFMAKGDILDLSPTDEEDILENEGFLKQLHNKKEGE